MSSKLLESSTRSLGVKTAGVALLAGQTNIFAGSFCERISQYMQAGTLLSST